MGDEKKVRYIASCSGGKDSVATIILAHEHGEPLDEIIFSEVMFDSEVSGELPEHIEFIRNVLKPVVESWGYDFKILHAKTNYMELFNHVIQRSKKPERIGKICGFPMAGRCAINSRCKVKPIKDYVKQYTDIVQYVGIASDEQKRLKRMEGTNRVSLLDKYGYTEEMALKLCEEYGLLSPIYQTASRGGCWFCPNAKCEELRKLRNENKELWIKLLALEDVPDKVGYCWNILKGISLKDMDEKLTCEEM